MVNDAGGVAVTGLAEAADACNLLAVNQKRVGGHRMRIAIIGQQDFGKAALEAFLARGDEVAAVFCAPETGRPDPLRLAAEARGVTVHQFPKLTDPAAQEAMRAANVEVGVMAYVTQFAPQDFCSIPKFGTIQFHPSLLPLHRGASSMSWAIIAGRTETGFSIFRPTDGLDEGPVMLTRKVRIEAEDTLGSLYFGKVFPMGVAALVEVAELVVAGKAPALAQYEPDAAYEGIIRAAESQVHWASLVDITYNLIRGCDPAPGAWTTHEGRKLFLFDAKKRVARTFAEVKGKKIGQVVALNGTAIVVHGQGGFIEVGRVRPDGGKKVVAAEVGLAVGAILGG
jgi:methionyl-tRNA formyltransferase